MGRPRRIAHREGLLPALSGVVALLACVLAAPAALAHGGAPAERDLRSLHPLAADDLAAALQALEPAARTAEGSLAALLLEAAGAARMDPATWPDHGRPIRDAVPPPPAGGTLMAMLRPAHARALAGLEPVDAAKQHVATRVLQSHAGGQFGDPGLLTDDIWALRLLHAVRADVHADEDPRLAGAIASLLANQTPPREGARGDAAAPEGAGWPWAPGGEPETDVTGMALESLARLGVLPPASAAQGAAFLAASGNPDGGYGQGQGSPSNCDSTVWAIRGLAAAGVAVPPAAWLYLRSLRTADGQFAYHAAPGAPLSPNVLCTAEVATLLGEGLRGLAPIEGYPEPQTSLSPPSQGSSSAGTGAVAAAILAGCAWAARRTGGGRTQ